MKFQSLSGTRKPRKIAALLGLPLKLRIDEDAFVYYLPAFLTFTVHNLNSERFAYGRAVNAAVCAVTQRSNYNLARLKRLSDAQIDAVISFLRFVRDNDNAHTYGDLAAKALQRYWETPDARRRTLIQAP